MTDDFLSIEPAVDGEVLPPKSNPLEAIPVTTKQPRMAARELVAEMGENADPLRFMLSVIADEDQPKDRRLDAAKAAAPFVYPKLGAVAVATENNLTIEDFINGLPDPD